MAQTRDYVARSLPDRTQRSGLLSAYIETGVPALERDLDALLTAVVREQNEQKTTVLKAAVVESEDRITVTMGTVRAEISTQIQGIAQQLAALSRKNPYTYGTSYPHTYGTLSPPSDSGFLNLMPMEADNASGSITRGVMQFPAEFSGIASAENGAHVDAGLWGSLDYCPLPAFRSYESGDVLMVDAADYLCDSDLDTAKYIVGDNDVAPDYLCDSQQLAALTALTASTVPPLASSLYHDPAGHLTTSLGQPSSVTHGLAASLGDAAICSRPALSMQPTAASNIMPNSRRWTRTPRVATTEHSNENRAPGWPASAASESRGSLHFSKPIDRPPRAAAGSSALIEASPLEMLDYPARHASEERRLSALGTPQKQSSHNYPHPGPLWPRSVVVPAARKALEPCSTQCPQESSAHNILRSVLAPSTPSKEILIICAPTKPSVIAQKQVTRVPKVTTANDDDDDFHPSNPKRQSVERKRKEQGDTGRHSTAKKGMTRRPSAATVKPAQMPDCGDNEQSHISVLA